MAGEPHTKVTPHMRAETQDRKQVTGIAATYPSSLIRVRVFLIHFIMLASAVFKLMHEMKQTRKGLNLEQWSRCMKTSPASLATRHAFNWKA